MGRQNGISGTKYGELLFDGENGFYTDEKF
jgi:hypothetical protein